jgi:V/A-type H+-transporting ATPase subunit E
MTKMSDGIMSDKLQELTDRLYSEGVDKARKEAERIVADAESRGEAIVSDATAEAKRVIEQSRKDAKELQSRTENELSMAARQAETALKQRIINILADNVLSDDVDKSLGDNDLLKDLILSAVKAWADSGEVPEIELVISRDKEGAFAQGLTKELTERLKDKPVIEFSDRMKNGFRIESKEGTYALSFTDKDFEEFFRSFLRDKTRTTLFGED